MLTIHVPSSSHLSVQSFLCAVGLIQSVPFVGFWYDHVVRTLMGRVLSTSGAMIHTAVDSISSRQDLTEDQKLLLLDTEHEQDKPKSKKTLV